MSWFVDGALRYRTSLADSREIYQQPFYLILNTAVGGHWPGFPDHTTVFPQYHEIEYVRWYVESEAGDFNLDGAVDGDDQQAFSDCFTGDGNGWSDPGCRFFDLDADDEVAALDPHAPLGSVQDGPRGPSGGQDEHRGTGDEQQAALHDSSPAAGASRSPSASPSTSAVRSKRR